jgi:putative oxidoreductase
MPKAVREVPDEDAIVGSVEVVHARPEGGAMIPRSRLLDTTAPAATVVVRLMAGSIFMLEGVKKFLFVDQWGAGRFAHIGLPHPQLLAPFVGSVEMACGALLIVGLWTRAAAVPLVVVMCVAILSTKVPILVQSGFWPMEAEARTDYAMLLSLLFLLIVGAGRWSLDAVLTGSAGARDA